jgi:AcrR family transcriptional regulator
MPRTEEANQHIRSEQRTRIADAARRVFARKGLADATVDDVAWEADVSHGLAYRYFANKSALFSELVIQDLQAPTDWLAQLISMNCGPMDKIRQLVTGLVESRREDPERYRLLAHALTGESVPGELRVQVMQREREMHAVLRNLIVDGQVSGEIAEGDPDQLVRAIFAALEGLTFWHGDDPDAYRTDFPDAEIFLRILRPW